MTCKNLIRAWVSSRPSGPVLSIQAIEPRTDEKSFPRVGVPWVMDLDEARKIFGDAVDTITEKPRFVTLRMNIDRFGEEA